MNLNVNTKKIRGTAIPQNNQAKKNLETARESLDQVVNNIPVDFTYAQQFKEIPKTIQPILDEIKKLNGFVDEKAGLVEMMNGINHISNNISNGTTLDLALSNSDLPFNVLFNEDGSLTVNALTNIAQNIAIDKSEQTGQKWIGVRLRGNNYGFYVDNNGNVAKNSNINGVYFGENGNASDETQFNMMLIAVNHEVPKGTYTKFDKNIDIKQDIRVLIDDDDSKYGILTKNEKGEWKFDYYGDCIRARNPAIRPGNGEYLTCGRYGKQQNKEYPYFDLTPNKDNQQAEARTFLLSNIYA